MSTSAPASRWNGKVALVTGASSGIGRAIATRLAAMGMHVIVTARRKERLDALCADVRERGGHIDALSCDLRDAEAIRGLFVELRGLAGGVDVLVNNAGLGKKSPLAAPPSETGIDRWREMLDVNVLALAQCTQEALVDMRARGDAGHVIHISSMASHRVPTGSGMYSASKFAVRSLTEGLRLELREAGSKIRVSAVSPGFVETEFAEVYHSDPDAAERTYGRFPVLQAEDIADAVAYLLEAPAHVQVHDLLIRPTEQDN